jgi:hypothetical protein
VQFVAARTLQFNLRTLVRRRNYARHAAAVTLQAWFKCAWCRRWLVRYLAARRVQASLR